MNMQPENSEPRTVAQEYYNAIARKDPTAARRFLADDLVFVGLFETFTNAEAYLKALTGLLQIVTRFDVQAIIAEGNEVAVFFELETTAPAEAVTLVAEWIRVRDGKIVRVQAVFDGRPFAAMFSSKG